MPKKPDNVVGRSEGPPVGGGRQTPEQAAVVEQDGGGLTDAERQRMWRETAGGEPGRAPVAVGGSSEGQADRMPAGGASKVNARADNPAVAPGRKHKTS
jgi:hypothetical protein